MRKKLTQHTAIAVLLAGLVIAPIAEAKRVGGGRNAGMARSSTSYKSNTSYTNSGNYNAGNYRNTPSYQQVPQRSGSGMGKVVAAGVAGAAIGAVAGSAMANNNNGYNNNGYNNGGNYNGYNGANGNYNTVPQQQGNGFSWFWLILLGGLAFFLFRKFKNKKPVAASTSPDTRLGGMLGRTLTGSQPNTVGAPNANLGGAYTTSGNALPDGTEPAAFLRFARQRFNHIQAMNSASNISEIQRYFTPDLFRDIQNDIATNAQTAEFNNLNAQLVDQASENGQYVASVRFSGLVSEDLNSPQQPFSEIWHFVKPVGSTQEWLVAGIQQES